MVWGLILFFFFQAEDGIRDRDVTGVQTCALPISILLFIFKLLLPFTLAFFGKTEIFMVNELGLPFNSGTIFAFLLIVAAFYSGLDPVTPYLDEKPNYERDYKTGKYIITNNFKNAKQNTDDAHKAFLPRMWSNEHNVNYMTFGEPLEFSMNPNYSYEDDLPKYGIDPRSLSEEELIHYAQQIKDDVQQKISDFRTAYAKGDVDLKGYDKFLKTYGEYLIVEKPTFSTNMKFMVQYQFGYMYVRYLLWNFVGRQNDNQGKYNDLDGNWITGIPLVDEVFIGSQKNLTSDMQNNKGRNAYFGLPFILVLIGIFYHAKKDLKSFYVLMALFLFTGLALKIYLNERPFEPRERDYALVGSFYVFAMWIAFGVYAIFDWIKKFITPKVAIPLVLIISFLASPMLMAKENWDDHNRSDKYTALAMAKAYLDSCDKNASLFTMGDNDTFPLWYMQEIEGYRTDIRIVNTSLFMTDWYIDQMKRKVHDSEAIPSSFSRDQYVGNKRDYSLFVERTKEPLILDDMLKFIALDDERAKIELKNGNKVNYYPSSKVIIPIDKNVIIKNKVVSSKQYDSIVSAI